MQPTILPPTHGLTAAGDMPSTAQWRRLTVVPRKRELFEEDLYFREAWPELVQLAGGDPTPALANTTLLCAKPDAVVGRRLDAMLDFAIAHGYEPVAGFPFDFTRHSMREIWRYDWHVYPPDRLGFSTAWYTAAGAFAFLLRDVTSDGTPASVRLSRLKGAAIASQRKPGELRAVLKAPNSVLNFVHVTDEPADIVREVGIFFGEQERRALFAALVRPDGGNQAAQVRARAHAYAARYPAHDLDARSSLSRLSASGAIDAEQAAQLATWIEAGRTCRWQDICRLVDTSRADRWDVISVAARLIELERQVSAPLMPAVDVRAWMAATV